MNTVCQYAVCVRGGGGGGGGDKIILQSYNIA